MSWPILLLAACAGDNPARTEIDARKSAPAAPIAAADWTCPMHLEVSSPEPGSCPKCGMPLGRRER